MRFSDSSTSFWIKASAGSGKTASLVQRLVALLLSDVDPGRILCLTYTKNAATEMKDRLYRHLLRWTILPEDELWRELAFEQEAQREELCSKARKLYLHLLESSQGVRIHTVHSFAQHLLALFPREAGLSPGFEVLEGDARTPLLLEVIPYLFQRAEAHRPFRHGLQLAIEETTSFEKFLSLLSRLSTDSESTRPCPEPPEDWIFSPNISQERLRNALAHSQSENIKTFLANDVPPWRPTEGIVSFLLTKKHKPRKNIIKAARAADSIVATELEKAQNSLRAYIIAREKYRAERKSYDLGRLGIAVRDIYEDIKSREHRVDYDDLLLRSIELLRKTDMQWIAYKLDSSIDHIVVDEAQDLSKLHWEFIRCLSADYFTQVREQPKSFFVVGDMKQSIFRFQGARPASFMEMCSYIKQQLQPLSEEIGRVLYREIPLPKSFRTPEPILNFVDRILPPQIMGLKGEPKHRSHKKLGRLWLRPVYTGGRILAMDCGGTSSPTKLGGKEDVAHALGRLLSKSLHRLSVPSKGRPLEERDIMILLQRRTDFMEILRSILPKYRLAVAGADKVDISSHPAVIHCLKAANYSLFSHNLAHLTELLRSPFIGMTDYDILFLLQGNGDPLTKLQTYYPTTYTWLKSLAVSSPFSYFRNLLAQKTPRGLTGDAVIAEFHGEEGLSVVETLLDMAHQEERRGQGTLIAFLNSIRNGGQSPKHVQSHGTDCIRISTVHGAKGLEAPFVILADATLPSMTPKDLTEVNADYFLPRLSGNGEEETELQREKREEYLRLFYVALTRTSDFVMLTGPVTRQKKQETWYAKAACTFDTPHSVVSTLPPARLRREQSLQRKTITLQRPEWFEPARAKECHLEVREDLPQTLGRILHELMMHLSHWYDTSRWTVALERKILRYLQQQSFPKDMLSPTLGSLHTLLDTPLIQKLFLDKKNSRQEQSIWTPNGIRRLDFVHLGKPIRFLDYKTGSSVPKSSGEIPFSVRAQIQDYRTALQNMTGHGAVEGYVVYLQKAKIFRLNDN